MSLEKNISKIFGIKNDEWLQHANPLSVWTRFVTLPFLSLALWSRVWLGWYSLIPIFLIILWVFINPRAFKKPRSTNNWASKAVLGERVLANKDKVEIPQHHLKAKNILSIVQSLGGIFWLFGIIKLEIWPLVLGVVVIYLGKMWFLDRMVWLFEDMKDHSEYKELLY